MSILVRFNSVIYRKNSYNALELVSEALCIIHQLPETIPTPTIWYMARKPEHVVMIDHNQVKLQEIEELINSDIERDETPYLVFGSDREEGRNITLCYINRPVKAENRYSIELFFYMEPDAQSPGLFRKFITKLASNLAWDVRYILLETQQYDLHKKRVFPDKLSVGWMLYLPETILPDQVPSASATTSVNVDDTQLGTIITSVPGFFDGKNEDDIRAANQIEIELVSHDLLPKQLDI